jgi:hypothetical protein
VELLFAMTCQEYRDALPIRPCQRKHRLPLLDDPRLPINNQRLLNNPRLLLLDDPRLPINNPRRRLLLKNQQRLLLNSPRRL